MRQKTDAEMKAEAPVSCEAAEPALLLTCASTLGRRAGLWWNPACRLLTVTLAWLAWSHPTAP